MDTDLFAAWLFCGLGRAHLHLQNHDSAPHHAALLHACLYNPVYDRQCEGTRAEYLHELLALTGDPASFQRQILDAFAAPDDDMDVAQLFDFAHIFAQSGDARARDLMYEQFAARPDEGDDFGPRQLIELDGIDGFRVVAARLGEAASLEPGFWDDALLRQLKERAPNATTDADIAALGTADPAVQRYLDAVAATMAHRQQRTQQRKDAAPLTYAVIKEMFSIQQRLPSSFELIAWGMHASDDDLRAAAHDLLRQDDPLILAAYLTLFAGRAFPLGFEALLPFARHEHERVAQRALQALSLFHSPALRQVGLDLLRDNWHSSDALGLFVLNYQPGDEQVFIALLDAAQTQDEVHALGFGLVDILANNPVGQADTLQRMLYERQPCSLCRSTVVQQMAAARTMPAWMLDECHYDAEEDTRSAVAAYHNQAQSAWQEE